MECGQLRRRRRVAPSEVAQGRLGPRSVRPLGRNPRAKRVEDLIGAAGGSPRRRSGSRTSLCQRWPGPGGWFTHRPKKPERPQRTPAVSAGSRRRSPKTSTTSLDRGEVGPYFSGSARLCTAAAWCASGRPCEPQGAGREGVRGPEPGLDRCGSSERAPRAVTTAVLVARRCWPQGRHVGAGRDRQTQQDPALVVLNRSAVPRLSAPSRHQNRA